MINTQTHPVGMQCYRPRHRKVLELSGAKCIPRQRTRKNIFAPRSWETISLAHVTINITSYGTRMRSIDLSSLLIPARILSANFRKRQQHPFTERILLNTGEKTVKAHARFLQRTVMDCWSRALDSSCAVDNPSGHR